MFDNSGGALELMLERLNRIASSGNGATVHMKLANGSQMTIRAGGAGVRSWPSAPPFLRYEVLVSARPPRFWKRFAAAGNKGAIYGEVPRLLICHHITRAGGMDDLVYEMRAPARTGLLEMEISMPQSMQRKVILAVNSMHGVQVVNSTFVLS
jgi:hypothetical protein